MPLYVVIPLDKKEAVNKAVMSLPQEDIYRLKGDSGWIVRYKGTSKELTRSLGIGVENDKGVVSSIGSALVVSLATYYGFGPSDMWEWIGTRAEA